MKSVFLPACLFQAVFACWFDMSFLVCMAGENKQAMHARYSYIENIMRLLQYKRSYVNEYLYTYTHIQEKFSLLLLIQGKKALACESCSIL